MTPLVVVATVGMGGGSTGVGVDVGSRGGDSACSGDGHRMSIIVNVTIFLPISESTFVDHAAELLLARY